MITYLIAHLLAGTGISTTVGTRVRPGMIDQAETLPAISYTQISRAGVHHRSGPDELAQVRWQFDVHARTYSEATTITDALIDRLQTFSRSSSPRVDRVFVDTVRDSVTGEYDDLPYYRRIVDVLIWTEE